MWQPLSHGLTCGFLVFRGNGCVAQCTAEPRGDAVDTSLNAFAHLQSEWQRACAVPGSAAAVRGWLVEDGVELRPMGSGLPALLHALKYGGGQEFSDQWLSTLLRRVAGGDELALLVTVQAMTPSTMKSMRRLRVQYQEEAGYSTAEFAQLAVTAVLEVVRRYPLERRPQKIALNIAWDTYQRASREIQRDLRAEKLTRTQVSQIPVPDPEEQAHRQLMVEEAARLGVGDFDVDDLTGARAELVELLVWALKERVVGREGVRALTDHYREGAPLDRVAAQKAGVSAVAWRRRRSRAVQQLRNASGRWLAEAA